MMSLSDMTHALMALVGGTDDSKNIPNTFDEAWNHEDLTERELWREAIRKELSDMIKRKVWRQFKKIDVPKN